MRGSSCASCRQCGGVLHECSNPELSLDLLPLFSLIPRPAPPQLWSNCLGVDLPKLDVVDAGLLPDQARALVDVSYSATCPWRE